MRGAPRHRALGFARPIRPAAPDRTQRRAAWRAFAEASQALAERAGQTDGRETVETDDYRHNLVALERLRFDVDGASAADAAAALLKLGRALVYGGTPERTAIVAPALLAAARCVDALLTDQADRDAQSWKRQTGEQS